MHVDGKSYMGVVHMGILEHGIMIPVAYLNGTSLIAMKILHGVNKNPSFIRICFGTKQKVRKQ